MVYYFRSITHPDVGTIYMPENDYEAKEIFSQSRPKDIWFGTKDFPSNDIYLRVPNIEDMANIPYEVIEEICQLVKAYSIEGAKKKEVSIIYTFVENLGKVMDGFTVITPIDRTKCRIVPSVVKDPSVLKLLLKAKTDVPPEIRELYITKVKNLRKISSKGSLKSAERKKSVKRDQKLKKSLIKPKPSKLEESKTEKKSRLTKPSRQSKVFKTFYSKAAKTNRNLPK